ncbi:MAG: PepSY-like domain-containing protein [Cyclobacteriaceae bacterium]
MRFLIKTIAGLFIFATLLMACDNQEVQVPQQVQNAFSDEYPDASGVDWEKEGENYVVDFRANELDIEITYDARGNVIEKLGDVEEDPLPPTSR